ncbi:hypothetical protein LGQ03_14275 [Loktanella sp. TSTF-M6]|uniref:Transmembrane protein PGPGW n=1 Tax=Loktanella gaetbuli TaxID=2881335 RepID=A0ABS8BXD5_9RHOB|nr:MULTISPECIES: hypothetical protein [Loktanella]MCB5200411.1 hypothetical protein [Loktanella gaetbuli]
MSDRPPSQKPPRQIRFLSPVKRERARLERQFAWLRRYSPVLGRIVQTLSRPGWTLVRVPVGILFILGGFLAILPIFGLWMIPVGLLLLSVDVPRLRRPVAGFLIAMRRRAERWKNRKKP